MNPQIIAVVAGVPETINENFAREFKYALQNKPILTSLSLHLLEPYSRPYATKLYERLASKLRHHERTTGAGGVLKHANLIILYFDKQDKSELALFEMFGFEAFVVPFGRLGDVEKPMFTGNQKRRAVNSLVQQGRNAVRHAQELLSIISHEVTNRCNRTCLLLPPKNYGNGLKMVVSSIRHAALHGQNGEDFKIRLSHVSQSLPKAKIDGRTYFKGRSNLVFRSPCEAASRHGLAPDWTSPDHQLTCVIRGRMRFGTSFNPRFHYDCDIPRKMNRHLPSCHGLKRVSTRRFHVNVSPNDNIR